MDALNPSTNDMRPLGRVALEQALGLKVGPARQKYIAGELVMYEPRDGDRNVARIVEDDGVCPHVRIEPYSVYREGFLNATWILRSRILGIAE